MTICKKCRWDVYWGESYFERDKANGEAIYYNKELDHYIEYSDISPFAWVDFNPNGDEIIWMCSRGGLHVPEDIDPGLVYGMVEELLEIANSD